MIPCYCGDELVGLLNKQPRHFDGPYLRINVLHRDGIEMDDPYSDTPLPSIAVCETVELKLRRRSIMVDDLACVMQGMSPDEAGAIALQELGLPATITYEVHKDMARMLSHISYQAISLDADDLEAIFDMDDFEPL